MNAATHERQNWAPPHQTLPPVLARIKAGLLAKGKIPLKPNVPH